MRWIEVSEFSYTYPGENDPVLRNINLSLEKGGFAVIAGKSGCGKSTLAKALAGFLFQDEEPNYFGTIFVNGTDMSQIPLYDASEKVGYVQQNPEDQFCTLTVEDEISFGLENHCVAGTEIAHRIDEALSIVQGKDLKTRSLASLSGGEKQKVAIATMLALSPDVLILDEPTSNLDPAATQYIFDALHHMRTAGNMTVIIIEHKLAQLMPFNPQIFMLDSGCLQQVQDLPSLLLEGDIKSKSQEKTLQSPRNEDQPVVRLSHVNVSYDNKPVLRDVNLALFPGEFAALMGKNGSGKTTLLQTIIGFNKASTGNAALFNQDLSKTKISNLIPHVGYIFQNPDHQLFTQSVWDEASFTSKNLKMLSEEKVATAAKWLTKMGLADRLSDHPQRLSYGEKRRLNLVAVLLHEPHLLLIDEILIGQDMENAHEWMQLLRNYALQGNTVLLVNHHAGLTQRYCDRLIFLEEGHILFDLPIEDAFDKLAGLQCIEFLPNANEERMYA